MIGNQTNHVANFVNERVPEEPPVTPEEPVEPPVTPEEPVTPKKPKAPETLAYTGSESEPVYIAGALAALAAAAGGTITFLRRRSAAYDAHT